MKACCTAEWQEAFFKAGHELKFINQFHATDLFYTPSNHKKIKGFLMLSGFIEGD